LKTKEETFPGANATYSIESMMQDGKALQNATTHDLGTNFAKTFDIKYQGKDEKEHLCHTTSWAFSTRTIGGIIMMHGDDDGLVMPPNIAPYQIVILPVVKEDTAEAVNAYCEKLRDQLKEKGIRVKLDNRDMRTPDKMWDAVKKGIPLRVEVGGREVENNQLTHIRRDIGRDSKTTVGADAFLDQARGILDEIHNFMLSKQQKFTRNNTADGSSATDVEDYFKASNLGFIRVPTALLEDESLRKVMSDHALTTRNMPFEDEGQKVLIAKAY
jgi:prolyl-tRNA synthetase